MFDNNYNINCSGQQNCYYSRRLPPGSENMILCYDLNISDESEKGSYYFLNILLSQNKGDAGMIKFNHIKIWLDSFLLDIDTALHCTKDNKWQIKGSERWELMWLSIRRSPYFSEIMEVNPIETFKKIIGMDFRRR